MNLSHGTTRTRAEKILQDGPDPYFQEPGGSACSEGFSMTIEDGPFHFGRPDEYARGKAREFPSEGGPVILTVDVPDDIVARTLSDWFSINQGLVQFDFGAGLDELLAAWPHLHKEIRDVS